MKAVVEVNDLQSAVHNELNHIVNGLDETSVPIFAIPFWEKDNNNPLHLYWDLAMLKDELD